MLTASTAANRPSLNNERMNADLDHARRSLILLACECRLHFPGGLQRLLSFWRLFKGKVNRHSAMHVMLFIPGAFLPDDWNSVISRVAYYLSHEYSFGRIKGSVLTLLVGALIFCLALLLSRTLSKLLQRRISKSARLDPGLHYTIGRLTQYLIVTIGLLFALSFGLGLDLTSAAVLFTALSVGIGFGLQYIAADIASGFILLFERPVRTTE